MCNHLKQDLNQKPSLCEQISKLLHHHSVYFVGFMSVCQSTFSKGTTGVYVLLLKVFTYLPSHTNDLSDISFLIHNLYP